MIVGGRLIIIECCGSKEAWHGPVVARGKGGGAISQLKNGNKSDRSWTAAHLIAVIAFLFAHNTI